MWWWQNILHEALESPMSFLADNWLIEHCGEFARTDSSQVACFGRKLGGGGYECFPPPSVPRSHGDGLNRLPHWDQGTPVVFTEFPPIVIRCSRAPVPCAVGGFGPRQPEQPKRFSAGTLGDSILGSDFDWCEIALWWPLPMVVPLSGR